DEDIARFLKSDAKGFANLSDAQRQAIASFTLQKDNGREIPLGGEILDGSLLLLPPNLYIWATMNTSDQSLFPIDSAFKRRWNWRYVSINTNPTDPRTGSPIDWKFRVEENLYSWGEFLDTINPEILSLTESSDKQMGYFFAKADPRTGVIAEEVLLNKVLFYLWTDVFKDYDISGKYFHNPNTGRSFLFTDFFTDPQSLPAFIANCGLRPVGSEESGIRSEE
ncbi:MAG: hypothetical protein K2H21_03980, partial [Muribaculaceae bacterium]|nr:hypothetical protein [Muribaculaceae bacterium]